MASEYEMHFPFTTQKEILDWEARYIEDQSEKRQHQEQAVIDIEKAVNARKTLNTPGGYLLTDELQDMGKWKHRALPSIMDNNRPEHVEKITAEAFSPGDDWEKLKKLISYYGGLQGVRQSVASVILHLYDPKKYPILDEHALRSVGIKEKYVHGPEYPFWQEYVNLCRAEAEHYDVSMRTLDRALYKYSEGGGVFTLKIIADETLFLELERRGYDLSKLRDLDETQTHTSESVKIG
ncbi:MAG: hypothetical protein OXI43_12550 [Candidatus Poribacteria bacterium]|nr:hypothetical protein [Candidatus Poribacteria bacterium]